MKNKSNNNLKYKFVYVNDDGSVREVNILEKIYLQTKYSGGDGDRPYIKTDYFQKDGWGKISGFCYRKVIPENIEIKNVNDTTSRDDIKMELARIKKMGYEVDLE